MIIKSYPFTLIISRSSVHDNRKISIHIISKSSVRLITPLDSTWPHATISSIGCSNGRYLETEVSFNPEYWTLSTQSGYGFQYTSLMTPQARPIHCIAIPAVCSIMRWFLWGFCATWPFYPLGRDVMCQSANHDMRERVLLIGEMMIRLGLLEFARILLEGNVTSWGIVVRATITSVYPWNELFPKLNTDISYGQVKC